MLTYRLKYLFCLTLLVGIVLMWAMWYRADELTANRLLIAREKLKSKSGPVIHSRNSARPAPISSSEAFRLLDETGIPDSYTSSLKATLGDDINCFDSYYVDLWDENCRLLLQGYPVDTHPTSTDFRFAWQADWSAIEAKAAQENWTFYRQVIITVVVGAFTGWIVRASTTP